MLILIQNDELGDFVLLFVIDCLENESDVDFVARIYKEFMPMIKKRIYKHISDKNLCEDIAHDCFVDFIRYLDCIKKVPEDKLRLYLSVCVENRIKRNLKKSNKELAVTHKIASNDIFINDTETENEVEKKLNYDAIRKGIDKLDDRDKSILLMKYDFEMSDELIANALMINKSSVRMTVFRSLKKLKKVIAEMEAK